MALTEVWLLKSVLVSSLPSRKSNKKKAFFVLNDLVSFLAARSDQYSSFSLLLQQTFENWPWMREVSDLSTFNICILHTIISKAKPTFHLSLSTISKVSLIEKNSGKSKLLSTQLESTIINPTQLESELINPKVCFRRLIQIRIFLKKKFLKINNF